MFIVKTTKRFEKSLKTVLKRANCLAKIRCVIQTLQDGKKLESRYRDHKLIGNFNECRECHIQPDLLLIYKIEDKYLMLIDIGTHSDLF